VGQRPDPRALKLALTAGEGRSASTVRSSCATPLSYETQLYPILIAASEWLLTGAL